MRATRVEDTEKLDCWKQSPSLSSLINLYSMIGHQCINPNYTNMVNAIKA